LVRIAMRRCGSDAVEKILRFANDVWRCVECQMEDIGDSRADLRNRGRPARKFQRPSDTREMRQRVLHERVIALELLDRLFLTLDNIGELIDSSVQSRLIDRNVVQAFERDLDCIDLLYQGIIIPQQPGAGREQIAAQNTLVLGKPIKLCERSVERFGIAVRRGATATSRSRHAEPRRLSRISFSWRGCFHRGAAIVSSQ